MLVGVAYNMGVFGEKIMMLWAFAITCSAFFVVWVILSLISLRPPRMLFSTIAAFAAMVVYGIAACIYWIQVICA